MLSKVQNPIINIQKEMAKYYIADNRLEEALDIYLNILRTNPDDSEILSAMRALYFSVGNGQERKNLGGKLQNTGLEEDISKHTGDKNRQTSYCGEESIPNSPDAVRRLLQNVTKRVQPVSEDELNHAAQLLQDIVHSTRPAVEVAKRLDEIDSLLPALIDLNIRQARLDGRPDLASGLDNLKTNISLQKAMLNTQFDTYTLEEETKETIEKFTGRVVVFHPENNEENNNERIRLVKDALLSKEMLVTEEECDTLYPDIALFSKPYLDQRLMDKMTSYASVKIPIILDLDQPDDSISSSNENQSKNIFVSQIANRAYASALILADLITVASESYAKELRSLGYTVMTIPNGWTKDNPYWAEKKNSVSRTLRVGWFGISGHLEDLAVIRRPLIRLLREFENELRIVIVNDQDAFHMFDNVPEEQKIFVPCRDRDELPYIIDQLDILLFPTRKVNPEHKPSDDLFMYAGLKKIPWAASPVPLVKDWEKGGLVCKSLEEWHSNLRLLIIDKDLRQTLGNGGYQIAEQREMQAHIQKWYWAFSFIQAQKCKGDLENTASCKGENFP